MTDTGRFFEELQRGQVNFFAGVPDSLLKPLCAYINDHAPANTHVIAANEGAAVALAAGHYLATGRMALVYMQNSGLGNAVNPLTSLADPAVYGIPMILLVGWRGEPGVKDEPQHVKQGEITPALCATLNVPHWILPAETEAAIECLRGAIQTAREESRPVALIARADSFSPYQAVAVPTPPLPKREDAICAIAAALPPEAVIVATTGHISRELFEYRARTGQGHGRDFLTVGSMGHSSQIALGIALARPERPVVCLDGDGALLMHMGSLAITGATAPKNLFHIVINNGAHDSVGGQKTAGFDVDFMRVADACGCRSARRADGLEALPKLIADTRFDNGPHFLEIRVAKGARKDLGRPTTSPRENKAAFMASFPSP